ncbi:MAG: hypothetical protein M3310_03860, partial [Actinomycetota bacterium]|nr:hypothetical protein [Actinomycetota bacterium]
GEGATFLPLAEIVREAVPERPRAAIAALLEGDEQASLVAERVTQLTGNAAGAASPGEVFWAVRRFLDALARQRPLVVVLEDIHWAEPTLLDLIDYLDSWTADAPLLVVCLARRELLEQRPGWGSPHGVLALEPLSADQSGALVEDVAGADVDERAREQIVEIAEGNPLFLEQLLAFVAESGADALTAVPPTVEALLAARLDRLEPEERTLLERAAVVGRDFSRSALLTLSPPEELAALDSQLTALGRRGLVRPVRGEEDAYRFHHVLIRDIAYAGITKEVRADLHERYGTWLERRDGADEITGYHLEQAHRFRSELRRGDPRLPGLAERAGRRLASAGLRAFTRVDVPATTNLLARAAPLLSRDDAERAGVLTELGLAQWWTGDAAAAEATLREAVAAAPGDAAAQLRPRLELQYLHLFTDREADPDVVLEACYEAVPAFEAVADERALGRAWKIAGYIRGSMQGRCADWLEAATRALTHYQRAGWAASGCILDLATALFYGPVPADEAGGRCEQLLAETSERVGTAHALAYLGGLEALSGRIEEGLAAVHEAETIYRDVNDTYALGSNSGRVRGRIHRLAGDLEAAEHALRESAEILRRVQDEAGLSTVAAELGQVQHALHRVQDAAEWADIAEERAPAGDIVAQLSWRALRGKLLGDEGFHDAGEMTVREALEIVERTDLLLHHGDVLLDVADVARAAGRSDAAAIATERAVELFDLKQSVISVARARSLLAELAA